MFHDSVAQCWQQKALSKFQGVCYTYGELAKNIAVLQDCWTMAGLKRGDKIAINAKSGVNWITVFMASVSGGYVSVQLFNGFTSSDTQKLVCHSDSRILYTGSSPKRPLQPVRHRRLLAGYTGQWAEGRGEYPR